MEEKFTSFKYRRQVGGGMKRKLCALTESTFQDSKNIIHLIIGLTPNTAQPDVAKSWSRMLLSQLRWGEVTVASERQRQVFPRSFPTPRTDHRIQWHRNSSGRSSPPTTRHLGDEQRDMRIEYFLNGYGAKWEDGPLRFFESPELMCPRLRKINLNGPGKALVCSSLNNSCRPGSEFSQECSPSRSLCLTFT